jgi:hypothetical protein
MVVKELFAKWKFCMLRAPGGGWQELLTGIRRRNGKVYDPACNVKWEDEDVFEALVSLNFLSGHTTCDRYSNWAQYRLNNGDTLWTSTIGLGFDLSLPGFFA